MSRNIIDRILGRRRMMPGPGPAESDLAWARVISTARGYKRYFAADAEGVNVYLDARNPHRADLETDAYPGIMTEAAECSPHLREMLISEGGVPAADGSLRFSKERFIADPYSLFGLLRGVQEDLVMNGIEKAVSRRYERWTQERLLADAHPGFSADANWLILNDPMPLEDVPGPLLRIGAEQRPDGRVQIPRDGFLRAGLSVEIVAEMMGIPDVDTEISPA